MHKNLKSVHEIVTPLQLPWQNNHCSCHGKTITAVSMAKQSLGNRFVVAPM